LLAPSLGAIINPDGAFELALAFPKKKMAAVAGQTKLNFSLSAHVAAQTF